MDDHKRQLDELARRAAEDKTEQLREYYKLKREGLTAAMTRETELARKLPTVIRGNWYENRIIPLDESIPDHPAIAALVAVYNRENARRVAAGLPAGIALKDPEAQVVTTPAPEPRTGEGTTPGDAKVKDGLAGRRYAGSAACAGCHQGAWRVFQKTKHAQAMSALARAGRDQDPTCVGCHSTGYLLPGGTADVHEAAHRLRNVGCESCHGPGLEHLTSTDKKGTTTRQVAEITCLGCHTPDRTKGKFDYPELRLAILAPGHGA
jgi:hypothetical protein